MEEKKKNLSIHGYWNLGYFGGKTSLYEDVIDDLKDIMDLKNGEKKSDKR